MRKIITLKLIRSWGPCYDPKMYAPAENWSGTVLDVLRAKKVPSHDRLWVVLREELIPAKTLRLFACWCARRTMALIPAKQRDPRSMNAIKTAEQFSKGLASKAELAAAWAAAHDAAYAAYDDAAMAAATAAANARAGDAARGAAHAAAGAGPAVWDPAAMAAAARAAQIKKLISMLKKDAVLPKTKLQRG